MEEIRSAAFGSYLKTVRLEKGIKLSTISEQTRIVRIPLRLWRMRITAGCLPKYL